MKPILLMGLSGTEKESSGKNRSPDRRESSDGERKGEIMEKV